MNRVDLEAVIMGRASLAEQLLGGIGSVDDNATVLEQLASVLVSFNAGFEVLPGTVAQ